jgi:glycine cleavage system H protein
MLDTIISAGAGVLLFVLGVVVRGLVAIGIIAAVALPIAAALKGWSWLRAGIDRLAGFERTGDLYWRKGCFYTPGHLWLRPRGEDTLRIGLDDVGQRVLPRIARLRLPDVGTVVTQGDELGRIDCPDDAVVLRAPVSGVVGAVNGRVVKSPGLVHADPYRAWLVDVRPIDRSYGTLPSGARARAWLLAEEHRLSALIGHELGVAAADGGELTMPAHRLLTPAQLAAMRREFLGAGETVAAR